MNREKQNKISVLMANYNNGLYIGDAINSLLLQTSSDWELLIVDDCSTDNSWMIIEKYKNNDRVKIFRNEKNFGYIHCLKFLTSHAEFGIIGILDSDDTLLPNAVEVMLSVYDKNDDCGFIYSQFEYCDEKMQFIKMGISRKIPENSSNIFDYYTSAWRTYRKEAYLRTGGYDEAIEKAEDRDIILKLEEVTKFYFIDKILYQYRQKEQSETKGKNLYKSQASNTLARYCAYIRRIETNFPNLSAQKISEILLIDGFVYAIFSGNKRKAMFFLSKSISIMPCNILAWLKLPLRIIQEVKHVLLL
jgi:glycosyltransferase involved in cell wall biosynthesis